MTVFTTITSLNLLIMALYAISGFGIWRADSTSVGLKNTKTPVYLAWLAVSLHLIVILLDLFTNDQFTGQLDTTFSCAAFVLVVMYLATSLYSSVSKLGLVVLLTAALGMLISAIWPGHESHQHIGRSSLWFHTLGAILAYSFLGLGVIQALLLITHDKNLKTRPLPKLAVSLPAMDVMEAVLFRLLIIGFSILTITLLTGSYFADTDSGKPFPFNHHTVLSIIAWVCFGTLLAGRWRLGWRGLTAARWTLVSFFILLLAYFGTRIVSELILQR